MRKDRLVFNQLLSITIIVILMCSLVAQVETSSVNALADPATGITASSKSGTLQIDHSEYDVTYVNSTIVKISGTIVTIDSINKLVTILFTLPDGTTKGSQIAYNGDGTFQTSFPLDSNSQKGTYSVSASYAQNILGALTFTVKLKPISKSALPISPPPIRSQNNSSLATTNNQQNVPVQTIPDSITQSPSKLPKWIKSTFVSYAQGDITEDELLNAITFLVQNNIIKIQTVSQPSTTNPSPSTTTNTNTTQTMPNTSTNKMPEKNSGQPIPNTIPQQQVSAQPDLIKLIPTYDDGITWSPRDGKDTSYQDDAGDPVQAYEKNYVKSQDMGSGAITVGIKKFTSTDKAKTNTDNFISRVKSEAKSGFSDINGFGFPSECQGIKEDFGLEERNGIFCTKNNFSIYVTGLGSLYDLDDEATNFAKIVLTKIG